MTVSELIERLQQLPSELPVYVADWNEKYAPDNPLDEESSPRVERSKRAGRFLLPERVVIG